MKKGWEIKELGDVCEFYRGLTYSKNDEVNFSNNIVLRSNNIDPINFTLNFDELKYIDESIKISNDKRVQKNTIMICTANGSKSHLGKVAYIDKEYNYAFGGFMGLIKPKSNILSLFLYYSLTTPMYKDYISKLSDGVNINNLKFSDLSLFHISIPQIQEQKEIVKKLDKGFELIDSLKETAKKNVENAKKLFQSALREELSPKEGWKTMNLGEVAKIIGGGTPHKNIEKYYSGDILWATVRDMKNEFIYDTEFKITQEGLKNSSSNIIPKNNIIIATRVGLGKVCKLSCDTAINQDLKGILPVEKITNSDYLYYYFISQSEHIIKNGKGATVQGVTLDFINSMKISFPTTIKEQEEIVKRLDKINDYCRELEENYSKVLELCEEMKQGLLREAFLSEK